MAGIEWRLVFLLLLGGLVLWISGATAARFLDCQKRGSTRKLKAQLLSLVGLTMIAMSLLLTAPALYLVRQ